MKSVALILFCAVGYGTASYPTGIDELDDCPFPTILTCPECERTCSDRFPICPFGCAEPVCTCAGNYVRHEGICMPEQFCPEGLGGPDDRCGENEVFTDCSAACQPSCDLEQGIIEPFICPAVCRQGCICDSGFVRMSGICVPEQMCPGSY